MNEHRALRRTAAALFLVPALAAGACSTGDDGASGAAAPDEANMGVESSEAGGGPSPSVGDDGGPIAEDDAPEPVAIDADAIQFELGGTQMLCWADADDGSDDSVFGCQGAAGWDATEGPSPASVLLFTVADDGEGEGKGEGDGDDRGGVGGGDADDAKEGVRAVQANAPVTAWQIQGVRSGGRYLLGDATIDLTDRERLTFTVEVGDESNDGDGATGGDGAKTSKSGWVTVEDYAWDE